MIEHRSSFLAASASVECCGGVCSDMRRFTFRIDCGVAIPVPEDTDLRLADSNPEDCLPFKLLKLLKDPELIEFIEIWLEFWLNIPYIKNKRAMAL